MLHGGLVFIRSIDSLFRVTGEKADHIVTSAGRRVDMIMEA